MSTPNCENKLPLLIASRSVSHVSGARDFLILMGGSLYSDLSKLFVFLIHIKSND